MPNIPAYDELIKRVKEVSLIGSCSAVLEWDERTYMPPKGSKHRADQLTLLSGLVHSKFTDPKIGELLSECEQSDLVKDPDSVEAVNIREIRHLYDKRTKLPQDLVEELTKTTTLAQGEWVKARANKDFKAFLPWLEKVIALTKDKADAYGYENERYDSLLDDYEPGAKTLEVEETFSKLRDELVKLLDKIKGAPNKPDLSIIERKYDVALQKVFGESVAQAIGFDFNKGRLDITTHPFCSGFGPGDTRITTRYNPNRLNDALFGIMHETGHALYDMGLDQENHYGTPMGDTYSLGLHESQSRTWENQVGRSKSFWKYFFPQAQRIFKDSLGNVSLDEFYGAINHVSPSYIRVEADEATYNLHILLRFELERGLMTGDIAPADVRDAWNERFKNYFGIEVDHDSNGCLQDVHWSSGYIGYFPTYCLGNLFSAQFFAKAKKDIKDLDAQFEKGDFSVFLQWLRDNIHIHGSRYRGTDMVKKVTGEAMSYKPLIEYMTDKFSGIYGF